MSDNAPRSWTLRELHDELRRFEAELKVAGLRPNSVHTYVNRSEIFLRWLSGDYTPQGPRSRGVGVEVQPVPQRP